MKKVLIVFVISIPIIIFTLFYKRIQFEYYRWDFSSQDIITREKAVQKIVDMGKPAVPYLIDVIKKPYIFEEYYALQCLRKITLDYNYNPDSISTVNELKYWEEWWKINKHKY